MLILSDSFASGPSPAGANSGTSKSGKTITLRVPVELCAGFYPGDDQILAGIGCEEPVEHSYERRNVRSARSPMGGCRRGPCAKRIRLRLVA